MSKDGTDRRARRALLAGVAALAGLAALARPARAAKASKEAMKYQDHSHAGQECDDCLQFIRGKATGAMGECNVVQGPISQHGWCIAFVKKS
jgi:High potential iron-sulfur protein